MRASTMKTSTTLWLILIAVMLLTGIASAANVSGAIFTTTSTGTTVNGNIYAAKSDVYLNGGPQNKQDPGLVPDGTYYFQVTDPSGAVLLSLDDISCRQVVVSGGRIVGVPPGPKPAACVDGYHLPGTPDPSNGQTPVQLCNPNASKCGTDFADTPNPGGEYKAWLTQVVDYVATGNTCDTGNFVFGFCDSKSKTDNFKIRNPNSAYITVCKFNDLNGNGTQDGGEPLIPFWPITAMGVDTLTGPLGTVDAQTDATGCVSFSISTFPNQDNTDTVTLNETLLSGWVETAPLDSNNPPISVSGFVETIGVKAGDNITAPDFGNFCASTTCGGMGLVVTKDANPSITRTFTWGITKSVDTNEINTHGNAATFNYTVSVTHDAGTDSGWQVTGTIKVSNPNPLDITGVNVSDAVDNGGSCSLTGGTGITVPANMEVDVPYTCTYSALPVNGTNTATALSPEGSSSGMASIDFSLAAIHAVDGSVTVTDDLGGSLGTVSYTDPSPKTFTYSLSFNDPAGTCTSHKNTATFTTNTTATTGSASQTVTDCQGANLTVTKTAATAYSSNITKSVDKTLIETGSSTATFNYTVNVTTSAWTVSGIISVTNPNDWEAITANVTDALTDGGGSCVVTGGLNAVIPASTTVPFAYACTFSVVPGVNSGMNVATATWDSVAFSTPAASATGMAAYAFSPLTITDCFGAKGSTCTNTTLGTVTIPPGTATFNYSHVVNAPPAGTCQEYDNTATITQTGQSASATATVCNTNTGALTMGFWQNKNGQGIISGQAKTGTCASGTWLRQFNPFQDLSATATCSQVATYVTTVIKAATCGGSTCNAMLKAQMLATALDVYFSTPAPTGGGNKIGAFNGMGSKQMPIGGFAIDLSNICSMNDTSTSSTCTGKYEDARPEFGIAAPCLGTTVLQMLSYAEYASLVNGNPVSTSGGVSWYQQNKTKQVFAKDGFDNINNQIANIATNSCSSTF